MSESKKECVVCARDSQQTPLIALDYCGKGYWICPQHLPVLIHHPEHLAGKLPGAENLSASEHKD